MNSTAAELIFRDNFLIIACKPAGLLSVPGRGEDKQDCLSARLKQEFPDAQIVHRLDMATSGLMLFARGAEMQRHLSMLFREHQIGKRYTAVVQGLMHQTEGKIDLPIIADWPNRPLSKVDPVNGKPSLTLYRKLFAHADSTRLELVPVTGRSHQLRLHLAAIGHPILGDAFYGDGLSAPHLLLHACSLSFIHPVSGEPLNFINSPPF